MTTIETLFVILAAIISLPSLCRLVRRPAMLYCSYLVIGVALGSFIGLGTRFMLHEIGGIGFILLLFLIGLEIEMPKFSSLKKALPFTLTWMLVQLPLFALGSWYFSYGWEYGFVAGAGINACSLGIAYGLLQSQESAVGDTNKKQVLVEMVFLEIMAVVILVCADVINAHGWGEEVLWKGGILALFLLVMRLFSGVIHKYLGKLLESSGKWRIHQLFLILLLVTMIGQRLGLSAPKTAFFLGLFMSAATHKGIKFEDELKPIAQRILIPLFFIGLGSGIALDGLLPYVLPLAIAVVLALLSIRYWIFVKTTDYSFSAKYFLLYSPNITMVAVSAEILNQAGVGKEQIDFLLTAGLLMTLGVAVVFPTPIEEKESLPQSLLQEV